ncbi:MAG: type II secretion system protein GspN [Chthoniobacteraceae bacterium]
MRKLIKGFLIVAAAIVGLLGAGVLAINLYVQSAGTQKRIEQAVSSGLKAPVHLGTTTVTPWGGLKAAGITVPQVGTAPGNFLEAASFTAHFKWMGLFHRQLDVSDVSLNEPCVEWFQSPSGRWELPRVTPPPPAPGPKASPTPGAPTPAPTPASPAGPRPPEWQISVHKLTVNEGVFDFWDERGMRALEFAGVQFDCLEPRAAGTGGSASCKYVSLRDMPFFNDMQTDWSFANGRLKLSSFQTEVGNGEIRGDAQMATETRHSPFSADMTFDGVDVNRLMVDAGQPDGEVTGTLKGQLKFNGNAGKRSSLNGTAHLELAGGRMQDIELLQMLGQGLQIPDLIELNLKTAVADATVVNGMVNVNQLLLESQNLQLAAKGTIDSGEKLHMDARLTIDGAISERLPTFILNYFTPGGADDSHYIDFQIGNTLTHPKTNLLENLLGHRIQGQMTDLLKSIFGKKAKPEAPEATPP